MLQAEQIKQAKQAKQGGRVAATRTAARARGRSAELNPSSCAQGSSWQQGNLFPATERPTTARAIPAERHLRAARQLSRAIRAQKADRVARKATGIAICSHLLALLEASDPAPHTAE